MPGSKYNIEKYMRPKNEWVKLPSLIRTCLHNFGGHVDMCWNCRSVTSDSVPTETNISVELV